MQSRRGDLRALHPQAVQVAAKTWAAGGPESLHHPLPCSARGEIGDRRRLLRSALDLSAREVSARCEPR